MKFKTGGCWESQDFDIVENEEITYGKMFVGPDPNLTALEEFKSLCCKHAHSFKEVKGKDYKDYTAIIPFTVEKFYEGSFHATGVCAECIAEGLKEMKKERVEKAVKEINKGKE